MTIDAPVILSALFFTIIAIIVASAFLAKKPAQKKEQKQHEERSERVTEYHQPIVEQPAPAPAPIQKEVTIEKKREDPVPVAPVVEAEVIPVQQTPVQVRCVLVIQCTCVSSTLV